MKKIALLCFGLGLLPGIAAAQLNDVTMEVVEGENAAAVNNQIRLPEAASDRARERSAQGIETANQARERTRERDRLQSGEVTPENMEDMRQAREQMREQRLETMETQQTIRDGQRETMGQGRR